MKMKQARKFKATKILQKFEAFHWPKVQKAAVDLGNMTADVMQLHIKTKANRKPLSGKLENAIKCETLDTTGKIHLGIGEIDKLPEYWYVVNYGTHFETGAPYIPFYGNWAPRGSFQGTKSKAGGGHQRYEFDGKYTMQPKQAITPLHYIERGQKFFKRNIKKLFRIWSK